MEHADTANANRSGKISKPTGGYAIRFSNTHDNDSDQNEDSIAFMPKSESTATIRSEPDSQKNRGVAQMRSLSLDNPGERGSTTGQSKPYSVPERDGGAASTPATGAPVRSDVPPRSFIGGLRKKITKKIEERKTQLETSPLTEQFPILTKVLDNLGEHKPDRVDRQSAAAAAVDVTGKYRSKPALDGTQYHAQLATTTVVRCAKPDPAADDAAAPSVEVGEEAEEASAAGEAGGRDNSRAVVAAPSVDYVAPAQVGCDAETVAYARVDGGAASSAGRPQARKLNQTPPKSKQGKTKPALSDKVTMSSLLSRSIDECAEDDPMVSPPGGSAPEPNFDWPDDDFGLEMVDRDGLVTEAAEAADAMVETAEASPRQPRPDIGRSAWRQSMWKLAVVVAVLIAFYLLPLAGQIKGAVIGAVVALVIHRLFTHIFAPSQPKKPIPVAPLKELPPMLKPEVLFLNVKQGVGEIYKVWSQDRVSINDAAALVARELAIHHDRNATGQADKCILQVPRVGCIVVQFHSRHAEGWMNELLCDYSIDGHHINQTFSVYVRLEGYNLRLSRPKTNIPHRMMFDEQRHDPIFVHQRHFDLTGSKVFLLPPGLVSKRLWSKKYPICIALARTGSKRTVKPPIETNLEEEPEQSLGGEVPRREECSESILYLFARTCREKEEWFRRFQMTILYADLAALSSKERPVSRTPSLSSISSSSSMKDVASERKEQQQQPHGSSDVEKPSEIEMSSVAQRMGHRKTASDGDVSPLSSPTHEHETTAGSWFAEAENLLDGTGSKPGEEVPVELLHRRSESEPNFASFDEEKSPPSVARQELEKGELSETASYPRLADASEGGTQGHNERRVKSSQVAPQSPVRSRVSANTAQQLQFNNYMARLIPSDKQAATNADCQDSVAWLNALLGRLFWDFLRENLWAEKVAEKIQKKLSMIKVPYFIDELTLTDIELGVSLPVMRRASLPWVDDRGLWVDLEVAYSGSFKMTLSTKVNLMKLKKDPEMAGSDSDETDKARRDLSAVTDSDVEDSAESSSDEESQAPEDAVVKNLDENSQNPIIIGGASVQKKFLRMVDKITASRYFQQATEYKYIKKAMENVSKVPLLLTVEVHSLTGTMALNVPPPPTDRLWMGFRNNPLISISARPKLGARLVNIEYVTDWIEKKLVLELQRVLVMPNMDDLEIPIMQGNVNMPRRPDL